MEKITTWIVPPKKPLPPGPEDLHLWLIDLDNTSLNFEHSLNQDERDRAERIRVADGARRFIAARGALRVVLGTYLDRDARTIEFCYGDTGKPELADQSTQLQFNLTHSGRFALLSLSGRNQVGVDIEPLRQRPYMMSIAEKVFGTPARKRLEALEESEQTHLFYQLWTTMEARVKCRGKGVFAQADNGIPAVTFEPEAGWVAAVALAHGVPPVSKWCTYRLAWADS